MNSYIKDECTQTMYGYGKLAIAENKRTLPKKKSTEIINVYNLFIYQINIIQTIPRYINMFNYFNSVKNEKGLCRLEK